MRMGIVGLGRMGSAIALRAVQAGHEIIGYDPNKEMQSTARSVGIEIAETLAQVAEKVRIIWLMVPVDFVDTVIKELLPHLQEGDILIDGGNSNFKDSMRRADMVGTQGVLFLDCGTSGGVHGREFGFCLMVGGDSATYTKVHELLVAIAAPGGVAYVGPSGAGHYVKMIHNGIEYGLLQAYAEGFHLIKEGQFKNVGLDLEEISRLWNTSSIIRSFILELAHNVFLKDQELREVSGEVEQSRSSGAPSGMGLWTVEEAHEQKIPVRVIEQALDIRAWSRETGGNYATKVVAMLRKEFGGHAIKKVRE
ncbi:MAG: decarboxylating 6-phosphogluconate dehydrogenase [bacterium]|nr:decarboxylating 6-phosphogluconate dehydrogenase [bacterium]